MHIWYTYMHIWYIYIYVHIYIYISTLSRHSTFVLQFHAAVPPQYAPQSALAPQNALHAVSAQSALAPLRLCPPNLPVLLLYYTSTQISFTVPRRSTRRSLLSRPSGSVLPVLCMCIALQRNSLTLLRRSIRAAVPGVVRALCTTIQPKSFRFPRRRTCRRRTRRSPFSRPSGSVLPLGRACGLASQLRRV